MVLSYLKSTNVSVGNIPPPLFCFFVSNSHRNWHTDTDTHSHNHTLTLLCSALDDESTRWIMDKRIIYERSMSVGMDVATAALVCKTNNTKKYNKKNWKIVNQLFEEQTILACFIFVFDFHVNYVCVLYININMYREAYIYISMIMNMYWFLSSRSKLLDVKYSLRWHSRCTFPAVEIVYPVLPLFSNMHHQLRDTDSKCFRKKKEESVFQVYLFICSVFCVYLFFSAIILTRFFYEIHILYIQFIKIHYICHINCIYNFIAVANGLIKQYQQRNV